MDWIPIDEMPHLVARLGRAKVERIRYQHRINIWRQPAAANLSNTLMCEMQGREPHDAGCGAADILTGIARLDHSGKQRDALPLNIYRLYTILQCMPLVNTREVQAMSNLSERQAQRYVKACKLALPLLARHFGRETRAD